jgi:hypothetical protein
MLQFLALNGWQVDPNPPKMIGGLVVELAAGTLNSNGAAARLAPRPDVHKGPIEILRRHRASRAVPSRRARLGAGGREMKGVLAANQPESACR